MSFLQAEIERKRKQKQQAGGERKRYRTKKEIEEEERAKLEQTTDSNGTTNGDNTDAANENTETGTEMSHNNGQCSLDVNEAKTRLRKAGHPITLFGESDYERECRLLKLQEEGLEQTYRKGLRNEFHEAMKEIEMLLNQGKSSDTAEQTKSAKQSLQELIKKEESLTDDAPKGLKVLLFIKRLLREWEDYLENRAEEEQRTQKGKAESAMFKQSERYLKPLFKQLKRQTLPEDILEHLSIIVGHLKNREYVLANDQYVEMSIGKAPWPIGVTMVGIHERSAREKIFASQVAHVLNDETQRKYIQSVKRLMTFAQKKYPTVPSKMVM